jgi:hypothetical protein
MPTETTGVAAPTVTAALPELAPLEHDFDLYGPTGTCVAAGTYAEVPCAEPHEGEVFTRLTVPGEEYPGSETLQSDYAARCDREFLTLAGETPPEAGLVVIGSQPSAAAWGNGLHDVVCIAMSGGSEPNVGSISDG